MQIIEHVEEMKAWSAAERRAGRRIVLVPTMGALHEGHLSLVREGRKRGDKVVVSLFVNPAQFAPGEDLAAYPRDFARDRSLLDKERVDALFHPPAAEIYPAGYQTYIEVEKLAPPGHFRGVATVVAKLFNIALPNVAIFGLKDYQQLQVVRRMARDLDFGVEIVGCPTVRDADGLALSSRNAYLSPEEKKAALSLSRALARAAALVRAGERESRPIRDGARAEIEKEPLARVEYLKICDPETLAETARVEGAALLALAARVGRARLIDNAILKT